MAGRREPKRLRDDEESVISSVAARFSGTWRPGEDPPDAYLTIGPDTIAVEISTLVQHVTDDQGTRSRLSDDQGANRLVNVLKAELSDVIPEGYTVGLLLSAPILLPRKTQATLAKVIRELATSAGWFEGDREIEVNGNKVTLSYNHRPGSENTKVTAIIRNRSSDPDILKNAMYILEQCVTKKTETCKNLIGRGAVWLALRNDYWLSGAETYKDAFSRLNVTHPFEKILLVNDDGSVHTLDET